jgi:FkbH-like protein
MEIDYVRSALPEVTCILMPEDPADIMATFKELDLFDKLEVSDEDRRRHEMMVAERQRNALVNELTHEEFLATLDLKVDLFVAKPEDLGRITQLVNKTNQFNLTTRRRTLDEMRNLHRSPMFKIFGVSVVDKFGEYGLTGVVIAEIRDRKTWYIDTLLLSCRVLGRGVETRLMSMLADDARASGAVELLASYIPTPKNGLAATYLSDCGFGREDGDLFRLALQEEPLISKQYAAV